MEDAETDASGCGEPLAQPDFCSSWIEIFGVDIGEGLFILGLKKGKTEGSIGLLTARGEECTDEYAAG